MLTINSMKQFEVSLEDVKQNWRYRGHFFDNGTKKFFASRICDKAYLINKNRCYFMTSEKKCFRDYSRVWTVRTMELLPDGETTIFTRTDGESGVWQFETKSQAFRFLRECVELEQKRNAEGK